MNNCLLQKTEPSTDPSTEDVKCEVPYVPRPMSPVLSSSSARRKLYYERRRNQRKAKVNLATKLEPQPGDCAEANSSKFKDADAALQIPADCNLADRLRLIRSFDEKMRTFSTSLYSPHETSTCPTKLAFSNQTLHTEDFIDAQMVIAADTALNMMSARHNDDGDSTQQSEPQIVKGKDLQASYETSINTVVLETDKLNVNKAEEQCSTKDGVITELRNSGLNEERQIKYFTGFEASEQNHARTIIDNHSQVIENIENLCRQILLGNSSIKLGTDQASTSHSICRQPIQEPKTDYSAENVQTRNLKITEHTIKESIGFKLAGGKAIKLSDKWLQKAKAVFGEEDLNFDCQQHSGFETARSVSLKGTSTTNTADLEPETYQSTSEETKTKRFKLDGVMERRKTHETQKCCAISDTIPEFSSCGFKKASGKPVELQSTSLKNTQQVYKQACEAENLLEALQLPKASKAVGFSTAGGKSFKMSDSTLKKAKAVFGEEDLNFAYQQYSGFETARSVSLKGTTTASIADLEPETYQSTSEEANTKQIKLDLNMECCKNHETPKFGAISDTNPDFSSCRFKKASGKPVELQSTSLKNAQQVYKHEAENPLEALQLPKASKAAGFSTAGGKSFKMSERALKKAKAVFGEEDLTSADQQTSFFTNLQSESLKARHSEGGIAASCKVSTTDSHQKDINSLDYIDQPSHLEDVHKRQHSERFRSVNKSAEIPRTSSLTVKRKLGISPCRQIATSNDKLRRAKLMFEECEAVNKNRSNTSTDVPANFNQPSLYSSTPIKEIKTAGNLDNQPQKMASSNSLINADITPLKRVNLDRSLEDCNGVLFVNEKPSTIVRQKLTEGNTKTWIEGAIKDYEDLRCKLKLVAERRKALEDQQRLRDNADGIKISPNPGVLWCKKQFTQRLRLKESTSNKNPGSLSYSEALNLNVPREVLETIPKNAEYTHFNYARQNKSEANCATVCTTDGARVIPNSTDLVGLVEIEAAFETMVGVDPKLLPAGWVSNHFRWVVWKLASLERNFPDVFAECLSVENVVQQLKYRYDREIDRAERPALRRILEKDDVPQKRMVLCVSDIIKGPQGGSELELTDGWYCIRTAIDLPLCKQINTSKIEIGTKLIVQCSEILNCDGCHPLDVPADVRLKINYNCTRRAMWDLKLGYQKIAKPFAIPLRTIHPEGGLVGCIKICVIRMYPLTFMEKQAGKSVWRNKKAEELRAQECANAKEKEVRIIYSKVLKDYENEMADVHKSTVRRVTSTSISEINSPKLLYQMLKTTYDPMGFKNKLSTSQIASVERYKSEVCMNREQEVSARILNQVTNVKSSRRDVSSVLKLRVIDSTETSTDTFILNVWNATEEHLHLLKEGCFFTVYYISPRRNGELSANTRTLFKSEVTSLPINKRLQRRVLPICVVQQPICKQSFNEYDTVGTVVQIHKALSFQELWLTDAVGRLLLVKIGVSRDLCCLLDNITRGQSISVMNLIFREPHDNTGQALANQCSVITCYPQPRSLQDALTTHGKELPKDLTVLLSDCDEKIERYCAAAQLRSSACSVEGSRFDDLFDESGDGSTIIPSRLTSIDVAMSLIDTDQYLEKP